MLSVTRALVHSQCRQRARWLLQCINPHQSKNFSSRAEPPAALFQRSKSKHLQSAKLPSSADVVIVGGGVAGCSVLYHLACLGVTDTILVEKEALTSGTTWHSGGILFGAGVVETKVEIIRRSCDLARCILEEESGVSTGWINNGSLYLAQTEDSWNDFRRWANLTKALGVECEVLQPAVVKDIHPIMDVSSLCGAIFCPCDGTVEPAGFTTALVKAATNRGPKVIENCAVTGVETTDTIFGSRLISAVVTEHGKISTNCVVNCAGAWASCLGNLAGASVPLTPYRRAYVVTERIDGARNTPNVLERDAGMYYRSQGQGLIFGGYEPYPIRVEDISAHLPFTLNEINWDIFSPFTDAAIKRFPDIDNVGIKSAVCGPDAYTPDRKMLFGESPELQGFFLGCGFSGSGVMLSGGLGQQLAELIVKGCTTLDMSEYDISRFLPSVSRNSRWLVERCHEGFRKNFTPVYPHDVPLAGRNMLTDALHQELLSAGCVYLDKAGWEVPGWFLLEQRGHTKVLGYDYYGAKEGLEQHSSYPYREIIKKNETFGYPGNHEVIAEESSACRNQAAILNMSACGKFLLFGKDALDAANWVFTSDMDLPPSKAVNTYSLNNNGGIELDVNVCQLQQAETKLLADVDVISESGSIFYLTCAPGLAEHVKVHLRRVLAEKDFRISLTDITKEVGILSLQGPRSRQILQPLTPTDLNRGSFSTMLGHRSLAIHSHTVHAFRLSVTGESGWELHIPISSLLDVYQTIWSAGQSFGLRNAGLHALETLSLEGGYLSWPADINCRTTPFEAGLQSACSTQKAYVGCEVVAKQLKEGAHSQLVSFTVERSTDCPPLHGGEVIKRNGETVGTITRAGYSHTLQQHIGRGYVESKEGPINKEYLEAGQYVLVVMGRTFPALLHLGSPVRQKE